MATATKLIDYTIDRGVDRVAIRSVYKIADLPHGNPNLFHTADFFPQLLDQHEVYGNALCVFHKYVRTINQNGTSLTGLAYADFRSNNPFSGGPQQATQSFDTRVETELPVWKKYSLAPSLCPEASVYYKAYRRYDRAAWLRIETRYSTTTAEEVADAVTTNLDKWYLLGDWQYTLQGANVYESGLGQNRIAYRFMAMGAVRAYPDGSLSNAVAIPALPVNAVYSVDEDPSTCVVPVVRARLVNEWSSAGTQLPDL